MSIFLPDSFCSFSRQGNSRRPAKTVSPQASTKGLGNGTKNMAKMLLHDRLANEFLYNFTESTEDITAEVRIITESEMFFNQRF